MKKFTALSAAILLAVAGQAMGQVQHGIINVVENDGGSGPFSISLNRVGGAGPWVIVSDKTDQSNRGDYVIDLLTGNDQNLGVLITSVAQNSRTEPSVPFPQYFCTAASERSTAGLNRYYIAMFEAPSGGEVNYNPAFAYFPIADGWLTAAAYNSVNNGPLTSLVGAATIQLHDENTATGEGIELIDTTTDNGYYTLRSPAHDFRRDGILLGGAAKNEDNRVGVKLNYDGSAIIHCIDNGSESGGENDPAAFVFIPENTAGVVMGDITGSGRSLFSQGEFTIEHVGQPEMNGTFRLTIPGHSPATGTLIVIPHTELGGISLDNAVFMEPAGDSWILTTRDTEPNPPAGTGMVLQDMNANDGAFIFAFIPNDVNLVPGVPSRSYLDRLDDVVAARFTVTEFNPNNTLGDMRADRTAGSDALSVSGDNKGDIGIAYFNARLAAYHDNALDTYEGFVIGSISEFVRDNSATGGIGGWSTFGFDNGEVRTHGASLAGGEINVNFALALFPASLGFQVAADVNMVDGLLSVPVSANAVADGVLMATNWNNSNAAITVASNGSQYDLTAYNGSGGAIVTDAQAGYIYLPYTTENLVAGQVSADGKVLSGVGDFTITTGVDDAFGFDIFNLVIAGVDAREHGVLLLNGMSGPYAFSWEAGPNGEFQIAGLDLTTEFAGRAPFAFAYIPYEGLGGPGTGPGACRADFNRDTVVNSQDFFDFLNAFFAAAPNADFNSDKVVNSQDFFDFLNSFFAGC